MQDFRDNRDSSTPQHLLDKDHNKSSLEVRENTFKDNLMYDGSRESNSNDMIIDANGRRYKEEISFSKKERENINRISEETSSRPISPWTLKSSLNGGGTSPSHLFNGSLDFQSNGHWSTTINGDRSSIAKSSSSKGPLDNTHSPLIVSPVSSSGGSSKPSLSANRPSQYPDYYLGGAIPPTKHQNSSNNFESDWNPTNKTSYNVFNLSPNHHRGFGDTMPSEDDEKVLDRQSIQDAYDYGNRRSNSIDMHRTYSAGFNTGSAAHHHHQHRLYQDGTQYQPQRGSVNRTLGGDYLLDAPIRSTSSAIVSPALDRLSFNLQSEGSDTNLYKSYQPDLLAIQQHAHAQMAIGMEQSRSEATSATTSNGSEEYSIFVGDLCPELREEDLVAQFLQPSAWPASHPFAIAHAHAQQVQGNYGTPAKIRPAPFTSTKSAKIMTDPLTSASRGFGFVRFSKEEDCARALIEMQGMVINPINGTGRPLRVCTATPKNRTVSSSTPNTSTWNQQSLNDAYLLHQHLQQHQDRLNGGLGQSLHSPSTYKVNPSPFSPMASAPTQSPYGYPSSDSSTASASAVAYSNNSSSIDPNNTTVFVGGLSSLISEDTLKTFFAPFGEIIYVKIPPGKGCGFVQFVKKADAERAIERMQGFPIGGGRIRLSWGRSQGDKAAAAAAQAVAQTAQMSHLANLAGLGALTPAQLSQLAGASLASPSINSASSNDASALLLRRLAAAAAAAAISPTHPTSREKEQHEVLERGHLPSMEHQHRQAQYQIYHSDPLAKHGNGYESDLYSQHDLEPTSHSKPSPFTPQWQQERRDYPLGAGLLRNEDHLASLFPSLRLSDSERHSIDQGNQHFTPRSPFAPIKQSSLLSPSLPQSRGSGLQSSSFESMKSHSLRDSSNSFSPFSPAVSPAILDDAPLPPMGESNENSFTLNQNEKQQQQQHHKKSNDYSLDRSH